MGRLSSDVPARRSEVTVMWTILFLWNGIGGPCIKTVVVVTLHLCEVLYPLSLKVPWLRRSHWDISSLLFVLIPLNRVISRRVQKWITSFHNAGLRNGPNMGPYGTKKDSHYFNTSLHSHLYIMSEESWIFDPKALVNETWNLLYFCVN